jgi:hypothetical protein
MFAAMHVYACGTKEPCRPCRQMSAVGTWSGFVADVAFGPFMTQRRSNGLLDDFIRECEHRGRDVEAKSLGSRKRR